MERLSGVLRDYDWGHLDALAAILGHDPPGHPEAEYWLGAHPGAPSRLGDGGPTLDAAIAADPTGWLGGAVAERFGELPFLVKILAARQALSIQAHPSAEQAAAGFARENTSGPAVDAPTRSYRDPNHKPELICALTRFEARCGFRDPAVTAGVLTRLGPALDPVRHELERRGPAGTAAWLLRLDADRGRELATAAATAAGDLLAGGIEDGDDETDAVRAGLGAELASVVAVDRTFPGDVGVVVALLLNHVVLAPGQALFLAAGTLHAYLAGVGVEVMANSDNVIRGGLTGKHVDVEELVTVLDDAVGPAPVQTPTGPVHTYRAPIPEFAVTRIDTAAGPVEPLDLHPCGPEIVLVTDGSASLRSAGDRLELGRGEAALLGPADGDVRLDVGGPDPTLAWRVTVG